jgi:hypothetical protein
LSRRGIAENIMNPPEEKPILDVALAGGFRRLAEEPPREIVIGTIVIWDRVTPTKDEACLRELLTKPGNAMAMMNFQVRDDGGGWCTVSTETRVVATDAAARRRFARYWRVIYPGSSLMRYTWLRAIARRAERDRNAHAARKWSALTYPKGEPQHTRFACGGLGRDSVEK